MKHLYRGLVLIIIFAGALMFMSKNIKEVQFEFDTTVKMGNATFPVMELKSGKYYINRLHGYSGNLDANIVRENITPVGKDKTFEVLIMENKVEVKKIKYEIRTISDNELLDSGSISALNEEKREEISYKSTKIKMKVDLQQGKEYGVKMTLITSEGRKIHYYTRIKYYGEASFLAEKMDFVLDFHNKIMDKEKAKTLITYLEPNKSMDNTSLALVNIHSSFENFSWGNMKPEIISDVVPTVKEFNIETAAIELMYYVSADAGSSKPEIYQVKEFFRVRYTKDRMYLLNYQRTMEAQFDIELVSMAKSEIKLGISREKDIKLVTSTNNDRVAFVRQGNLWYYNLAENKAVKVFSFQKEEADYIWDFYDQHNIRILKMEENGDMDFLVYGYMNRGDYEGRVAIILYKFYANERRIEEQVYIPLETTYQMLKEDLNAFSYVNEKGIFYFTINNVIYAYNIIAKRLDTIASGISEENVIIPKEGNYIGWQSSNIPTEATQITLLNLETEERKTLTAKEGDNIRILGSIGENIIYGYAHTSDIVEMPDGTVMVPVYKLVISDQYGNIVKEHEENNIYISEIEVKENIIELHCVVKKKSGDRVYYKKTKSNNLINRLEEKKQSIDITTRVTDLALTELYISLPSGFEMAKKPKLATTVNTIITEDTTLRFGNEQSESKKYYVYALGGILSAYSNVSEAVIKADEAMGVVVNKQNKIIWERGGKYNSKSIIGIDPIYTSNKVDSIEASLKMVIRYNRGSAAPMEDISGKSIYQGLKENITCLPLNLTGCTLEEVLYYVSNNQPVIAMKNEDQAIVITGYDEYYIYIIDPTVKTSKKMSLTKAATIFEDTGNVFISCIE